MEVSQYRGQDLGRGIDMQRHATSQKWFEIKHIQGYIEALSLCVGYRHHEREGTTVDASAPASRRHPTRRQRRTPDRPRGPLWPLAESFSAYLPGLLTSLRCWGAPAERRGAPGGGVRSS